MRVIQQIHPSSIELNGVEERMDPHSVAATGRIPCLSVVKGEGVPQGNKLLQSRCRTAELSTTVIVRRFPPIHAKGGKGGIINHILPPVGKEERLRRSSNPSRRQEPKPQPSCKEIMANITGKVEDVQTFSFKDGEQGATVDIQMAEGRGVRLSASQSHNPEAYNDICALNIGDQIVADCREAYSATPGTAKLKPRSIKKAVL